MQGGSAKDGKAEQAAATQGHSGDVSLKSCGTNHGTGQRVLDRVLGTHRWSSAFPASLWVPDWVSRGVVKLRFRLCFLGRGVPFWVPYRVVDCVSGFPTWWGFNLSSDFL